jgi:acyl-coenzyme A synthetase/AMP-(fatty) acid ligase
MSTRFIPTQFIPRRFIPISELLAKGRTDDFPVCVLGERTITWRDFALTVGGIAHALAPRPEPRWLIHCEQPLHFAAAVLAVLHTGRRAVVAPGLQPAMTRQLRPAYDAILGDGAPPMLDVRSIIPAPFSFGVLQPRAARLDLYTSGSSGEPKRVEKSVDQLQTEAQVLEATWGSALGAATVVATVPHHHIYGLLFRLIWPLAAGRCFDADMCSEPDVLMQALRRNADVALVSSPAHLARLPDLIALERLKPATRRIFSSGGPLPAAAAAQYRLKLGASPTEIYGSTESGGIAWREQDASDERAAWRTFPGIDVRIDDQGALCVRSPYLHDQAWLTMGDSAELLPGDRFVLKGRLDRVVKVEGKRISLPEMEEALRQHPWVSEAALVLLGGRKETLGAVVMLRGCRESGGLVAALREFLLERFERVLVPRQWRFVARMPSDERGKLSAAALRTLFQNVEDVRAS